MKNDYLNIYNNLIKLTRNKSLYYSLKNNFKFSVRLVILLFHFGFLPLDYSLKKISMLILNLVKISEDLFNFLIRV